MCTHLCSHTYKCAHTHSHYINHTIIQMHHTITFLLTHTCIFTSTLSLTFTLPWLTLTYTFTPPHTHWDTHTHIHTHAWSQFSEENLAGIRLGTLEVISFSFTAWALQGSYCCIISLVLICVFLQKILRAFGCKIKILKLWHTYAYCT